MGTARTLRAASAHEQFIQIADANGNKVLGAQAAAIVSLTDSTTGAATDILDDTTVNTKDDLASLAAKIEEILVALRSHGIIAT